MARIRVPATTANIGPGFDCLGLALNLYNHIELTRRDDDQLQITVAGSAADASIPTDNTNLVYRAVKTVYDHVQQPIPGLNLHLELEAPLARGLGSSASAISGGIYAANHLLDSPLTMAEMALLASRLEGHPDNVVPCLVGGLTASILLEDRVIIEAVQPAQQISFVVFVPDYMLETATARAVMPASVTMKDAVFNLSRVPFVLSALKSGDLTNLSRIVDDRLHQPYRIPLIKGYPLVADSAAMAGARAICISGAGPTILAVCHENDGDAVAEAGKAALQSAGVNPFAHILKADLDGCRVASR